MWYYSKNNKQIGPISDATLLNLFSSGKIGKRTQVWSPTQKKWLPLEESAIGKNYLKKRTNQHLLQLDKLTYIFRSLVFVLTFCFGYKIFFLFETLDAYSAYIAIDSPTEKLQIALICAENALLDKLISFILFVIFVFSAYFGYKWLNAVSSISGMLSKDYAHSSISVVCSFFVPIFNMIAPYKIISDIMEAALGEKNFKVYHFSIIFIWGIFWLSSIFTYFAETCLIPEKCMPDQIVPFYFAKIFATAVYMATAFMTLILASSIYSMQSRRLKMAENY